MRRRTQAGGPPCGVASGIGAAAAFVIALAAFALIRHDPEPTNLPADPPPPATLVEPATTLVEPTTSLVEPATSLVEPATSLESELASSPFEGTWVSIDTDGSSQTMRIVRSYGTSHEVVVRDDAATVCSGASSTMRGTGQADTPTVLALPQPVYLCDNGAVPEIVDGPRAGRR